MCTFTLRARDNAVADQHSKDVRDMRDYSRRQPRDFFLGAGSRAATIACGENGAS